VALPGHALRLVKVWSIPVTNEGRFTLEGETASRPYVTPHCSVGTTTRRTPFACGTPSASFVEISQNERLFSLEAEIDFRAYPVYLHRENGTSNLALPSHALLLLPVESKSVGNEGHFPLEAERVFRPSFASHCSRLTETWNVVLADLGLQAVRVWWKSVSNEGHFTLEDVKVFRPYLPSHCSMVTKASH
jgi:hypothetical protein